MAQTAQRCTDLSDRTSGLCQQNWWKSCGHLTLSRCPQGIRTQEITEIATQKLMKVQTIVDSFK